MHHSVQQNKKFHETFSFDDDADGHGCGLRSLLCLTADEHVLCDLLSGSSDSASPGFLLHPKVESIQASWSAFVCGVTVGALLLGYSSFHKTYIEHAQGILLGHWGLVVAAAIVGANLGGFAGLASMAMVALVTSMIKIDSRKQD